MIELQDDLFRAALESANSDAIRSLILSLLSGPGNNQRLLNAGGELLRLRGDGEAVVAIASRVERTSANASLHRTQLLVRAWLAQGEPDVAQAALGEELDALADIVQADRVRANALRWSGEIEYSRFATSARLCHLDRAEAAFREAETLCDSPAILAQLRLWLAGVALEAGRLDDCRSLAEDVAHSGVDPGAVFAAQRLLRAAEYRANSASVADFEAVGYAISNGSPLEVVRVAITEAAFAWRAGLADDVHRVCILALAATRQLSESRSPEGYARVILELLTEAHGARDRAGSRLDSCPYPLLAMQIAALAGDGYDAVGGRLSEPLALPRDLRREVLSPSEAASRILHNARDTSGGH